VQRFFSTRIAAASLLRVYTKAPSLSCRFDLAGSEAHTQLIKPQIILPMMERMEQGVPTHAPSHHCDDLKTMP
jgi:hypothetical protein